MQASLQPQFASTAYPLQVLVSANTGNDLEGSIPTSLSLLPKLIYVNLANNTLVSGVPPAMFHLQRLTHLLLVCTPFCYITAFIEQIFGIRSIEPAVDVMHCAYSASGVEYRFSIVGGHSQRQSFAAATAQLQCKQVSTVVCHLFGGCQANNG